MLYQYSLQRYYSESRSVPVLSETITYTRQSLQLVKNVMYHFSTFHFTAVFFHWIMYTQFYVNHLHHSNTQRYIHYITVLKQTQSDLYEFIRLFCSLVTARPDKVKFTKATEWKRNFKCLGHTINDTKRKALELSSESHQTNAYKKQKASQSNLSYIFIDILLVFVKCYSNNK